MTRAFLAVSFGPAFSRAPELPRAIEGLAPLSGETGRTTAGQVAPGRSFVVSWSRDDGLGTTMEIRPGSMSVVHGSRLHVHSAIRIDDDRVEAGTDLLGYGSIFLWQGPDIAACSTRPELLAGLAEACGLPLERDERVPRQLAGMGFLTPDVCGWAGVRVLRAGETVVLSGGSAIVDRDAGAADWATRPGPAQPLAQLVERAAHALTASVAAALDSGTPVVADLTAGRDSRMILAALVSLDALGDVTLQTVGGPRLDDVRTARALATALGASHRDGFFYPKASGTLAERFPRHVQACAGMGNIKDGMREVVGPVSEIRLSGLVGEVFRGWRTSFGRDIPAVEVADRITARFGLQRRILLRPDAAVRVDTEFRDEILHDDDGDASAWSLAHRFYAEVRLRSRMCRTDDFTPEVRVCPLYTRDLVEVGVDAMHHHPDTSIDDLVIERLAPGLDAVTIPSTPPEPGDAAGQEPTTTRSFMRDALHAQADERRETLGEIGGLDSAAWDTIDPAAYRAAVDAYSELDNLELGLVHGAAGAVLWMAD